MAFCTAADVETFALIDFHSDLETHLTNDLIPLVEDAIREYVGYDIDYATHTQTLTGNQTKELFLDERPVIAITSVTEDGSTLTYGNQEDYIWYDNGRLRRVGSRWSFAYPDNIVVTYTAGYDTGGGYGLTLPRAFRYVTARAAARMLESELVLSAQQEAGQIVAQSSSQVSNFTAADSESLGDYSINYVGNIGMNTISILAGSDMQILGKYRKGFFI
tara:strand:+ start:1816 stop:2469 length:654 start_codon:yes stop_codon:yes gene_type:complete